jgi:hypothetical protein
MIPQGGGEGKRLEITLRKPAGKANLQRPQWFNGEDVEPLMALKPPMTLTAGSATF